MQNQSLLVLIVLCLCFVQCQERNKVFKAVAISQAPFVFVDSSKTGNARYEGFFVDMVDSLFKRLDMNLTYELYEVPDNSFGSQVNGSWTGIMGQLNQSLADLAFSPLTITSQRVNAIDFTSPYLDIGLRILVPKRAPKANFFSFLQPFSWEVWLLVLAASVLVAFWTWIIDTLSPYGHSKQEEDPDEFHLNGAFLNTFMVMVGQDGQPGRSWSTRIVTLCYFFFILIVASTYTANLAAVLTAKKDDVRLTSLQDVRTYGYKVACVRNSAPAVFFETNPLVADVKQFIVYYNNYNEALQALRRGDTEALVWVNVIVDYTTNQSPCDTLQVGEIFNKGNYGIPIRKNLPYSTLFSSALLAMREDGTIESLYKKWWFDRGSCAAVANAPSDDVSVKITDLGGVFLFLLVGMFCGGIVLIMELVYALIYRKVLSKVPAMKHLDKLVGTTTNTNVQEMNETEKPAK